MIAYKLESQNPYRHPEKPMGLVWIFVEITEQQSQEYFDKNYIVCTNDEFTNYQASKNNEQAQWDKYLFDNTLRMSILVEDFFNELPYYKVDFTIHLKSNVVLIKKTEMSANGRPVSAKYYYPTVALQNLICQIDFEFVDNSMKFMIERKELLKYFKNDGTSTERFLIHQRFYNFSDIKEATESIQERTQARKNIIDEVKVFLNGFLVARAMAMGKTQLQANIEAMTIGGNFMYAQANLINAFIETASGSLKSFLQTEIATGIYDFLDWNISPTVKVRDYFVGRISY